MLKERNFYEMKYILHYYHSDDYYALKVFVCVCMCARVCICIVVSVVIDFHWYIVFQKTSHLL